jgi:hypothetical protein
MYNCTIWQPCPQKVDRPIRPLQIVLWVCFLLLVQTSVDELPTTLWVRGEVKQGDRIGRIFAFWDIVFSGQCFNKIKE